VTTNITGVWDKVGFRTSENLRRWPRSYVQSERNSGVACYAAEVARQLIKRSFSLAGRRTSVALEQEFWVALMHIAASHQETLTTLVAEADARRPEGRPLASALRVLALQAFLPTTVSAHATHRYR
jgi:predicted DNA-binding ribbon-helix-helix protein